jgi:ABC-type microcin C transport system duplicated ATPase subunit YejF
MRHYAEIGEAEKAMKILEEKGDKIALAKFYDKTSKEMSSVRRQIQVVMNDDSMSGADKRMEIDRLKELISMLAEQAERARKEMKKGE